MTLRRTCGPCARACRRTAGRARRIGAKGAFGLAREAGATQSLGEASQAEDLLLRSGRELIHPVGMLIERILGSLLLRIEDQRALEVRLGFGEHLWILLRKRSRP